MGLFLLNQELEANLFYKGLYSKYPLQASGLGYKYLKHESSHRKHVFLKNGCGHVSIKLYLQNTSGGMGFGPLP